LTQVAAACDFVVGRTMRETANPFNDGEVKRRTNRGHRVSLKP